jgi:hypothetical protein
MEVVTPVMPLAEEFVVERPSRRVDGKVNDWGFVDTSKVNANVYLSAMEKHLTPNQGPVVIRKPAPGYALLPEEISRLVNSSDAVLLGFGDCGTSTYYAVRDAAQLERTGVPAVVVCSDAFVDPARALAAHFGLADLRVVVLPHPLASRNHEEIRRFADETASVALTAARNPPQSRQAPLRGVLPRTQLPDDAHAAQEEMHRLGWTDGLPVTAPLAHLVLSMSQDAAREHAGEDLMPAVPPARSRSGLERWAANAVMAGCLPSYFPVVLAAMDALLDPTAGLTSSQVATNTSAPLLILNGPIRDAIQAESRYSCLGSGNRANAAIGRAVRLILRNIGGELPGVTDLATHGQPGKFTYCLAENEEESPWEPWHVAGGFPPETSTVTAVIASPPQNIFTYGCNTPEDLLDHFVSALTSLGHNNIFFETGPLLLLGPEHARFLGKSGLERQDIQQAIYEKARISLSRFPAPTWERLQTRRQRWFDLHPSAQTIGVADHPEDVHIVVAGGPGIHSQFISTAFSERPVIKSIAVSPTARSTEEWTVGARLSSGA